jgi:hypothetical protein
MVRSDARIIRFPVPIQPNGHSACSPRSFHITQSFVAGLDPAIHDLRHMSRWFPWIPGTRACPRAARARTRGPGTNDEARTESFECVGALVWWISNSLHISVLSLRAKRSNLAQNVSPPCEIASSPCGLLAMTHLLNYARNLGFGTLVHDCRYPPSGSTTLPADST